MIGEAVRRAPDIAREIVRRGHEAAAHGRAWENSYQLPQAEKRAFIADGVAAIEEVTGVRLVGWNAYWMRNSARTLDILQSLGFRYHIDEPSRQGGDVRQGGCPPARASHRAAGRHRAGDPVRRHQPLATGSTVTVDSGGTIAA